MGAAEPAVPGDHIPVVSVSTQPELGPAPQYALDQALAPSRDEDVLVIGSGSITHNLRDFAAGYSDQRQAHAQRIDAGIDMGFLAMDIYRFD